MNTNIGWHILKTVILNKQIIKGIYLVLLFVIISCKGVSPLSDKKIISLSELGVYIEIKQDPYDEKLNSISIMLFDKCRIQIKNDKVKIKVNSKELVLDVHEELYYTQTVRYKGNNILADDSFYFEIMLSDSITYPLAYIKTTPSIKEDNILLDKEGKLSAETKIEWHDLNEFDSLIIWKDYKKNGMEYYGGGIFAKSTIRKRIDTKNNEYTVPVAFYRDSISTAWLLHFEFHADKEGLINPYLLRGSSIELNSKAIKRIRIN